VRVRVCVYVSSHDQGVENIAKWQNAGAQEAKEGAKVARAAREEGAGGKGQGARCKGQEARGKRQGGKGARARGKGHGARGRGQGARGKGEEGARARRGKGRAGKGEAWEVWSRGSRRGTRDEGPGTRSKGQGEGPMSQEHCKTIQRRTRRDYSHEAATGERRIWFIASSNSHSIVCVALMLFYYFSPMLLSLARPLGLLALTI
jgi:hypothetical protein